MLTLFSMTYISTRCNPVLIPNWRSFVFLPRTLNCFDADDFNFGSFVAFNTIFS